VCVCVSVDECMCRWDRSLQARFSLARTQEIIPHTHIMHACMASLPAARNRDRGREGGGGDQRRRVPISCCSR
jgi:hypothetical protein